MAWRDTQTAFYNSEIWKRCRAYTLKRSGGLCERCYSKGVITPADVVHHIEPVTAANVHDTRITLNPANLMCLCSRCHAEIHSKKRWDVDPNGRLIAPLGRFEKR